jgi:cell division protein FtsN
MSTTTLIGIIGGIVVLLLVGVIAVILKKKPQPKKKLSSQKSLTDLPMPAPPGPSLTESDQINPSAEVPGTAEESPSGDSNDEISIESSDVVEQTVESWEGLPAGDYLDPDENGTVWFRANDGDNWYQNADESWTKWND